MSSVVPFSGVAVMLWPGQCRRWAVVKLCSLVMKVITNLCGKTKFSPAQILASRFVMLYVVNVHQMLLLSLLCYYSSLLSHSVLNLVEVGWRGLRVGSRFALFYIHSDDSCNNLCHDDSTINITNSITIIITLTYHTYLLNYLLKLHNTSSDFSYCHFNVCVTYHDALFWCIGYVCYSF